MSAFRFLTRHPLPMKAHFEQVLVLTYGFPEAILQPLLPPGLVLDTYNDLGFLAIAMVQTRNLRPGFVPRFAGADFFLTGYRVFTRYRRPSGQVLRGLRILRSDTDNEMMVRWGNRLTHYGYRKASVQYGVQDRVLEIKIRSLGAEADLHVRAQLGTEAAPLPQGSPFPTLQIARKFAGPLPFTFDYEQETHSIIRVQGVRDDWNPKQTEVEVLKNTFHEREPFSRAPAVVASAFHLANVPYRWKRGVCVAVTA